MKVSRIVSLVAVFGLAIGWWRVRYHAKCDWVSPTRPRATITRAGACHAPKPKRFEFDWELNYGER